MHTHTHTHTRTRAQRGRESERDRERKRVKPYTDTPRHADTQIESKTKRHTGTQTCRHTDVDTHTEQIYTLALQMQFGRLGGKSLSKRN